MLFSIYEIENKFSEGQPSKEEMDIILKYIGKHQSPDYPIKSEELKKGIDVEAN